MMTQVIGGAVIFQASSCSWPRKAYGKQRPGGERENAQGALKSALYPVKYLRLNSGCFPFQVWPGKTPM
ncbi:hypothetical protein PO124_33175 [Bacillus licheniformis]|nr:hypothetical protein [Bacillus licheniformis]